MKSRSHLFLTLLFALLLAVGIAPSAAQEESITIWGFADHTEGMMILAEQFTEEFGVEVVYQELPFFQIPDDVINFGPVGEGPDVYIHFNSPWRLVQNGALVPLDLSGMEDQFHPTSLDIFTYDGQIWGVPFAYENIALVRNTELVPEDPQTWEDVRRISEEIQSSGAARYGFVPMFGDPYHQYPIWSAFGAYPFGINEDGSYNVEDIGLNSEGGLAAAQWLSDFYNDGLAEPDMGDEVIMDLFEQGEIAMMITGPWYSQRIIDMGIPYSIEPIPGVEGVSEHGNVFTSGFALGISAFSEKQLLAEAFVLDFMMRPENMRTLLTNGREDGALTRFPAMLSVEIEGDPNLAGFTAAGETSVQLPPIPQFDTLYQEWATATQLIAQGEDPVETINATVEQVRTRIAEAASSSNS